MKTVIIGNGVSGISFARNLRKFTNDEIIIISDENDYFFSRTALMYVFMGKLKFEHTQPYENDFWKKNQLNLVKAKVKRIDTQNKILELENNQEVNFDRLVLATGSKPNFLNVPGVNLKGVMGFYHKKDLEDLEELSNDIQTAVIVGGGLIGIELAEMLISRKKKVILMVRENRFWSKSLGIEESNMIIEHIKSHGIDLRLEEEIKEIKGDLSLMSVLTNKNKEIKCEYLGLGIGVSPNIDLVKNSNNIKYNKGILTNEFFETSVKEIYAIGDCAELPSEFSSLEGMWYKARKMGESLAQNFYSKPLAFDSGIYFNSAKFLDIEYQVYGNINPNPDPNVGDFVWQNPSTEKLIRIQFWKEDNSIIGVNTLGLRTRQVVWEEWLKDKKSIKFVINNLKKANFDPEFSTKYEKEILDYFNQNYSN